MGKAFDDFLDRASIDAEIRELRRSGTTSLAAHVSEIVKQFVHGVAERLFGGTLSATIEDRRLAVERAIRQYTDVRQTPPPEAYQAYGYVHPLGNLNEELALFVFCADGDPKRVYIYYGGAGGPTGAGYGFIGVQDGRVYSCSEPAYGGQPSVRVFHMPPE